MMYRQQLNLMLFERNTNYNLKVLKEKKMVQSMHIVTTKFVWFILTLKKKKNKKIKKKGNSTSSDSNMNNNQTFLTAVLVLILHSVECATKFGVVQRDYKLTVKRVKK